MKTFVLMVIVILLFCNTTDSKLETFDKFQDMFVKVETDSPATIHWQFSENTKKYLLYCRYDHEDTSWFIVDSILRGDSSYNNNCYLIPRSAITEKLLHSCKEDTLFFFTMQSINDDNTYENNTRFFLNSEICYSNWVLWKSRIIPLRPYPVRRRWFE